MNADFWRERWAAGQIGFHEGKPNEFLAEHIARLRGRVLVPLCGKSDDLAFLAAQGHEVVGIELVEDAVQAFFTEHGLSPSVNGGVYSAGGITIHAGDVFGVKDVGRVDAIYDRAALVALPVEVRGSYVAHLRTLVPARTPGLLVTLEYPPTAMAGPPFTVPQAEVRELYAHVELIDGKKLTTGRAGQIPGAVERVYAVTL